MLLKLTVHISNCLELATLAEQRAQETTDPAIRSDNEKLAQSWRHLADSYQFVESLERFLSDKGRNTRNVPPQEGMLIAETEPAKPEDRPIIRRRRVKHTITFRDRLLKTAQEAREQAGVLPSGPTRDRLLLKAQQCETAAGIDQWVALPGSPPREKLYLGKKPKP